MLNMPKLPNWSAQEYERAFVITSLVGLFSFALIHEIIWNGDAQIKNMLIGALIGWVGSGAIQFLFGTTPNSALKDQTAYQQAINTQEALHATPAGEPPEAIPGPMGPRGPVGPQGPQGSHVAAFLLAALAAIALFGQGQPASAAEAACTTPVLTTNQGVAEALVRLGYLTAGTIQSAALTQAIELFQGKKGLPQDGIVGSKTRAALAEDYCVNRPNNGPPGLKAITVDDLRSALGLAQASIGKGPGGTDFPDRHATDHAACWAILIPYVQSIGNGIPSPSGFGLATAAQIYFDVQGLRSGDLFPPDIIKTCAQTTYDLRISIAQLATSLGIKAAAPALPIFPAFP